MKGRWPLSLSKKVTPVLKMFSRYVPSAIDWFPVFLSSVETETAHANLRLPVTNGACRWARSFGAVSRENGRSLIVQTPALLPNTGRLFPERMSPPEPEIARTKRERRVLSHARSGRDDLQPQDRGVMHDGWMNARETTIERKNNRLGRANSQEKVFC